MTSDRLRQTLRREMNSARDQTDGLFQMITSSAMYERPISERHRIIFYLGHLEAFDWNMICRTSFEMPPFNSQFDKLFAFGIDPVDGKLPDDQISDWPRIPEILSYRYRVRESVDDLLARATFENAGEPYVHNGQIFRVAIEHRLMHAETLAYLLHWLPYETKQHDRVLLNVENSNQLRARPVDIPDGETTLGLERNGTREFGWDNEFQTHSVSIPSFSIDALNITNGDYLEFLRAGGYNDPSLWIIEDWKWIQNTGVRHPKFWIPKGQDWWYRSMFNEIPLPLSWPVYVSHAEASAYARWKGRALPTEAQYHRAAFGMPRGGESKSLQRGNYNCESWSPMPVGRFQPSPFGLFDMIGNGWEWTSTSFAPFQGFEPLPFYSGYSADFFDEKHFVLKGASPRTAALLVRKSFRNWFQPHYPNVYATFRCVEN